MVSLIGRFRQDWWSGLRDGARTTVELQVLKRFLSEQPIHGVKIRDWLLQGGCTLYVHA